MPVELKVPEVGESISEVQIGEWLKNVGDRVERDETVVMIETDKVTVELPAPVSGVISEIKVKQGEEARVGDVIGFMEEGAAQPAKKQDGKQPEPKPEARADTKEQWPEAEDSRKPQKEEPSDEQPTPSRRSLREALPPQAFARVMPSARRVLRQKSLEPQDVPSTGPGGRLLKEDVERVEAREPRREEKKAPPARAPAHEGAHDEEVVAMSPMRRRIAERLVQSQQTAALLTTFNEIDMSGVLALRKEYQPTFQEKYGIKLGMMSFFVKATVEALKLIPQVNAEVRGTDVVYKNYYDIGVAVGGGKGLVVPIIRGAERLSFAEIEQTIADFGKRAQAGKLELSELQGGTFTISNGGVYGSLLSTPIINPPQSGILGMHAIQERPVAREGQVVVRPMMYIALTYDHRIVDGREAVTFLKRIKECVEQPSRILLEV